MQEASQELQRADAAGAKSAGEEIQLQDEPMTESASETPRAEQRGALIQAKQQQLALQLQSLSHSLTAQHRERTPRRIRTDGGPPSSAEKEASKPENIDKETGTSPPPSLAELCPSMQGCLEAISRLVAQCCGRRGLSSLPLPSFSPCSSRSR